MHGTEALEAFSSSGGSRSLWHGPPHSVRARVPRKDFGTPFLLYGRPLENRTTCSASGVVGSGVFARFRHKWLFFFFCLRSFRSSRYAPSFFPGPTRDWHAEYVRSCGAHYYRRVDKAAALIYLSLMSRVYGRRADTRLDVDLP